METTAEDRASVEAPPEPKQVKDLANEPLFSATQLEELAATMAAAVVDGGAQRVERDVLERLGSAEHFREYRGLGTFAFSAEEIASLRASVPDDELEILPTGEVYLAQIGYRQRLNDTFGPGAWGLFPMSAPEQRGKVLAQTWALIIKGFVVSVATGEHDYNPDRESKWQASYPTALESAKSNALMRCCKDIGVAAQCWSRAFTNEWRSKYTVHVYRTDRKSGEEYDEWRMLMAGPHWNETGLHPGSPNRDAWKTQMEEFGKAGRMAPTRSLAPEPGGSAPASRSASAPKSGGKESKASAPQKAAPATGSKEKPITDAQYGLLKGALKNNNVDPANLFEWLTAIHKVTLPTREDTKAPDGRLIPQRLFDKVLEFIRGGGVWEKKG